MVTTLCIWSIIDQMPPDIISLYEVCLLDCLLIVSLSNQNENGFFSPISLSPGPRAVFGDQSYNYSLMKPAKSP